MKTRAVVVSGGARTPIGLRAQPTAFLYRAAAVGMQQSALLDPDGEPATMCVLPTIDPLLTGVPRALQLAIPALDEAFELLLPLAPYLKIRLLVCVDDHWGARQPDGSQPAAELFGDLSRHAAKLAPQLSLSTSVRGPAGLGFAIEEVLSELESGAIDAAVVGGVHTDYEPKRIAALAQHRRLFSPDQLDGLIPGESAAFAVLMASHKARTHRLTPRAQVHGWATAHEKARPDNDESAFEAAGLTAAIRKVGEPLLDSGLRAGWILSDLCHETWRHYEFQAMSTRTQAIWCEPQYLDAPAQRIGYLGATAMPLHLVLASEAWRAGWAPHGVAVSFAGSDTGERAALLLSAP